MQFKPATKTQSRLRLALIGPSGSGKTFSALAIAKGLGGRTAVIDSERGSASKYAGLFTFDVCELETHSPATYIEAIRMAVSAGYDNIIVDSYSHAWIGRDGCLELVDKAAKRMSGNSYMAWGDVTPIHQALIDTIVSCKAHVIATLRSKSEYVIEKNAKGKDAPRRVGTAPVQRDGVEYEFDVTANMDLDHNMIVEKTRCPEMSGGVFSKPGADVARILQAWLTDGAPIVDKPEPEAPVVPAAPPAVRYVSEEQGIDLVKRCAAAELAMGTFCTAYGVERVEEILASDFERCCRGIAKYNEKRLAAKAEQAKAVAA